MAHKQSIRIIAQFLLILVLVLPGCAPLIEPDTSSGSSSTPVVPTEPVEVKNPDVFVDVAAFESALLQALTVHDSEKLQIWMAEPFLTGAWREKLSNSSKGDAIKSLFNDQMGPENKLELVKNADLKALMGDKDPLSLLPADASGADAVLISGWGQDGLDEAILLITRQSDQSLRWSGLIQVRGGFSGTRLGGIAPYKNDAFGFSLYLPKDYQVNQPNAVEIQIIAPQVSGVPGMAFIFVEPANGRSAEQVAQSALDDAKTVLGEGSTISIDQTLNIEGEPAFVLNHLPGQDINRQLFMVHNDLLYHMLFAPFDLQSGNAYLQAADAYAMIVNTFHFTK